MESPNWFYINQSFNLVILLIIFINVSLGLSGILYLLKNVCLLRVLMQLDQFHEHNEWYWWIEDDLRDVLHRKVQIGSSKPLTLHWKIFLFKYSLTYCVICTENCHVKTELIERVRDEKRVKARKLERLRFWLHVTRGSVASIILTINKVQFELLAKVFKFNSCARCGDRITEISGRRSAVSDQRKLRERLR